MKLGIEASKQQNEIGTLSFVHIRWSAFLHIYDSRRDTFRVTIKTTFKILKEP